MRTVKFYVVLVISILIGAVGIYNYIINAKMHQYSLVAKKYLTKEFYTTNTDKAVLLIHGYGNNIVDFNPLYPRLEANKISYVSVLLKGNGSHPEDLLDCSAEDWSNQVIFEYDKLKMQYNNVIVVGFSMGGSLAINLSSIRKPNRLIVLSPFFKLTDKWYYPLKPEIAINIVAKVVPFFMKYELGMINDTKMLLQYDSYMFLPLRNFNEVGKVGSMALQNTKNISTKILWFHSKNDNVSDYATSMKAYNNINIAYMPQKIDLYKSDHIILYDFERQLVIDKIEEYINE